MKKLLLILAISSFVLFNTISAQNWSEVNKSIPEVAYWIEDGEQFGNSVAINGNYAVIGDPYTRNTGSVVVLYFNGTSWDSLASLYPSDGAKDDYFGYSVDISENIIVVGAYADDDNGETSGSAYVFEKPASGWATLTETTKLKASDGAANDYFGYSVSISDEVIVVGAYGDDIGGSSFGSAYVFEKSGGNWTQSAKLTASDGKVDDNFGFSVSIFGNTIILGARYDNDNGTRSGSAYVFEKPVGGWETMTETAKLKASDGAANDYFGYSVSISNEVIVVGAFGDDIGGSSFGSAYVFEKSGSNWTQLAKLTASDGVADDNLGFSVTISGNTIVLGSRQDDDNGSASGSAYVYEEPESGWATATETAKLTASDGAANDQFGYSVGISGDNIIVGAIGNKNMGSVYMFEKQGTSWTTMNETDKQDALLYGNSKQIYGRSVSISGNYAVVGSPGYKVDQGIATVLYNNGTSWETVAKLSASDGNVNDNFGFSVSISGNTIVVGARFDDVNGTRSGSVYVFEKPSSGWKNMTETAKLTASDGAANDYFGYSICISNEVIVVGAYGDDIGGSSFGSAYVFEKSGSNWTQSAKLTASDGKADDNLGFSVSISGNTIVLGSRQDDDNGSASGSAYVFEEPASGWATATETAKLTASDGATDDQFGYSVSISGDFIVVGAPGDDDNGSASGSAYVYEKFVSGWKTTTEVAKLTSSDGIANENFGFSVSMSGNVILIGSNGDPDSLDVNGVAYLFVSPVSSWETKTETAKLTASDGETDDQFGYSVCISGDNFIIGAIGDDDLGKASGSAYIFNGSFSTGTSLSGKEQNGIAVFPNPVSGVLTVQSDGNTLQWIKIIDLTGQVIIEKSGADLSYELDLSGLKSSIYLLSIQTEKGLIYTKIIKE